MRHLHALALGLAALLPRPLAGAQTSAELQQEVRQAETAFAGTMAKRDFTEFAAYVAEEALFFSRRGLYRGKPAVLEGWQAFFEGPTAPFAWEPEVVEVLASGTLALSSGPVRDPTGKRIGTFNSVWRRDSDGRWRVVFDKGCPMCECGAGSAGGQGSGHLIVWPSPISQRPV